MRVACVVFCLLAGTTAALAAPAATQPFEVVKEHVDLEVYPDGSDLDTREESFRVLNAQGVEGLHERKLFYTQDFETLDIKEAYTLKANGTRIDVPKSSYLSGFGETSKQGFQDTHIISLFYPNLEVGDQVVLVTVHRQVMPWFTGQFDLYADFSGAIAMHDVRYAVTAPASLNLEIDAAGVTGGTQEAGGGKNRWVWEYHNDTPVTLENDSVSAADFSPHIRVTSFASYADVAHAYRDRVGDRAKPTPEISALADDLTKGVTDKRAQAKILYEWVSSHIGYVDIVLGAGGFTPHYASQVLSNRFGDCKDHVVLLEALLSAKGIDSTAALIGVGTATYKLPGAPSPHAFDHVITYLPAFKLYTDSTAQLAPFGVLPYSDVGKPVLMASTGAVAQTPVNTSATSTVRAVATVTFGTDGSAQGNAKITGTGAYGIMMRGFMQSIPAGKENDLFRASLGPGAEGTLDRGDPRALSDPFSYSATYHLPNALNLPGTGSLPGHLSFKPFYFSQLVAGSLPVSRNSDYLCLSLDAEEDTKLLLPEGVKLLSIPDSQSFDAQDIHLRIALDRAGPRTLMEALSLKIDHPRATCTPEYYARVHGALVKMSNALRQEVIYRATSGSSGGGEAR
jgi:transglutaminase-like putative cysteine protease